MNHKKTFFDEDIIINEKLFDNFKINDIVSWSHLELWCAIQNVEVNYAFFKGILCGTAVIKKIFDIVYDALVNTDFLDKFIANEETIELIEKLFVNSYVSRTFKGKEFWVQLAYDQLADDYIEYCESGINSVAEKKYKLLNIIFKKNPFAAVKFYNKSKMALHAKDVDVVKWLLKSFNSVKQCSALHMKVYNALHKEIQNQNNLNMYLN